MAALSQDKILARRGTVLGSERHAIKTASTIYKGSMVCVPAGGRAQAAGVVTGGRYVGVADSFYSDAHGFNESSGVGDANGTVYVNVVYGDELLVAVRTAVRTNALIGRDVIASDDQTIGGTAVGTNTGLNQVLVGEFRAFEASDKTTGWVANRVRCGVKTTI